MIYRSKAPLRLGLAGGGTDVSPYSDMYGGAILNATINMYAHTSLEPRTDGMVSFVAPERAYSETIKAPVRFDIEDDDYFILQKGVYNRVVKDFNNGHPLSLTISSFVDAPAGCGLGTSSTLTVGILGAYVEWLKLPLGEYDIAKLAYEIERKDLGMAGGTQDQYAATFGGINFMEFSGERVIVNPLRIRKKYVDELNNNLILYYTNTSHVSANIIKEQQSNVSNGNSSSVDAMHQMKAYAYEMKEKLLQGEIDEIGNILNNIWKYKKRMAKSISNEFIDKIYDTAIADGATGGKISGAGGGGFMFFYCPGTTRHAVIEDLNKLGGRVKRYEFVEDGLSSWNI